MLIILTGPPPYCLPSCLAVHLQVGTWGISYEGTAALLTGMSGHPAVRAVCPMYCFLDVYSDVVSVAGTHIQTT